MRVFRWDYRFALISNCLLNFIVLIQGTDVKGFDDTVLFKIHWPGRSGDDLLVSKC
jgi:endoplasmic reticulum lectin 1